MNSMYSIYWFVQKTVKSLKYLMVFSMLITITSFAQQTGSISGKVIDKKTNEELIGANILVVGTTTGASSDLDGNYTIKGLTEGLYTIKISYISYQSLTVQDVKVKAGTDTKVNISLESSSTELAEVVVTAEALKNTEANVLKIQKNSSNIVDGVSEELIKKNNSSDGSDILKRMTGVTISEGKYAYIRGVSDRYNNTMLNGANLPSTDPEKKSFSYDIFPASLIENVITAKTFTPDKPADFSGGLVQINTIEFPSNFLANISLGGSYNTLTTGKSFLTYNGGSKDFLGYDDGTRSMPSTITDERITRSNYTNPQLEEITRSFNNDWNTHSVNAPFNGSLKLDLGNKFNIGDESVFGFIGSFTYSNSGDTRNLEKSFYDFSGARYNYKGSSYDRNVNLSALLNLSYKIGGSNKISLKNVYNRNADDITTYYEGVYRYALQNRQITSIDYVSRTMFSNQIIGEHEIGWFNGFGMDWNLSYAKSKRNEPDARRYVYYQDMFTTSDPYRFLMNESVDTRFYGDLEDENISGTMDFTLKLFTNPQLPKIKIGGAYSKKDRNFDARSFGFRNDGTYTAREDSILQLPVQYIFIPENASNRFIQVLENTKASDSYEANQVIGAGYVMFDATALEKFRIVAGLRYENSVQEMNTFDLQNHAVNIKDTYDDILPSVNLTYLLNDLINVRAAFSTTLARPEFREMAPFSYFDFIANELIQGNPDLKRALINNYDLRFELFPGANELVAVSLFYKRFKNPIEQTLQASANEPIRSFTNADRATSYGAEIELRKSLAFIAPVFNNFAFVGNASVINSNVEISDNAFQQADRPLQGQAPYIMNFGLYYDNTDLGLNAALNYNKVGQRIIQVGTIDLGNTLEEPVDLIDFSVSKSLFESFSLKFAIKDLLNQERIQIQQAPAPYYNQVTFRERVGRIVSFSLSYKL